MRMNCRVLPSAKEITLADARALCLHHAFVSQFYFAVELVAGVAFVQRGRRVVKDLEGGKGATVMPPSSAVAPRERASVRFGAISGVGGSE